MTQDFDEKLEMSKIDAQDHPEKALKSSVETKTPPKAKSPMPVVKNAVTSKQSVKTGVVKSITQPKKPVGVILDDFKAKSLLSFGLNKFQIEMIYSQTPDKFVKSRLGRGRKNFDYIPVYITVKYLNMIFGCGWDFEITKEELMWEHKQVLVKGKLTVHLSNGNKIVKEQYASKEIQYYKDKPGVVISIGDDLKGAASLCLTKCASYLGLFSDVYSNEYYAKYEMPDGIEESGEVDKIKLFNDTTELLKKVPDESKSQVITKAIESGQFTDEQNKELSKLKINEPTKQQDK